MSYECNRCVLFFSFVQSNNFFLIIDSKMPFSFKCLDLRKLTFYVFIVFVLVYHYFIVKSVSGM